MNHPLLSLKKLSVTFPRKKGNICAVKKIELDLNKGEILGLVGESGCGKSATAEAILFPQNKIITGDILFQGDNLLTKSQKEMQLIRGKKIGMVFQDPLNSLNPTLKIGEQVREIIHQHECLTDREENQKVLELLRLVGITDPELRVKQYPFQFSGGMRQRIMIAIAMACKPDLIIADEPTTSLDPTIQAQVLALLKNLCRQNKSGMLFISHDLGVVAGMCDRVAIMKDGEMIEIGEVEQIYYHPKEAYTKQLIDSAKR